MLTENPAFFKKMNAFIVSTVQIQFHSNLYTEVPYIYDVHKNWSIFVTMSACQEEMLYRELVEEMFIASHIQLVNVRLLKYTFIPPVIIH